MPNPSTPQLRIKEKVMHKCHLIMDFQYGSTGKGLLAGYLAKRENYDTAVCAFATNAGHTYIDASRGIHVMTQQLPTAITSPTVKNVLIGPGAAIHVRTLMDELERYKDLMVGKRLMIHPYAAIVEDYHTESESKTMLKIGSTAKGVGAAYIERIKRDVEDPNVAINRLAGTPLSKYVVAACIYDATLEEAENVIVEGAQGFSLSMYHGAYPYTTSRDVTPWQIAADCGLPFKWASRISIYGTLRTYPIRVNNREGSSGPCYPDQHEIHWEDIGVAPELTTVTKLPRRIFSFSIEQLKHALLHCGHYWQTNLFLNFANYMSNEELQRLIYQIEKVGVNPPKIAFIGFGADDADIKTEVEYGHGLGVHNDHAN